MSSPSPQALRESDGRRRCQRYRPPQTFPQELFDIIIDHIDDFETLRATCLVSKNWVPRCRFRLYGRFRLWFAGESVFQSRTEYIHLVKDRIFHFSPLIIAYTHSLTLDLRWTTSCHIKEGDVWLDILSSLRLPQLRFLEIVRSSYDHSTDEKQQKILEGFIGFLRVNPHIENLTLDGFSMSPRFMERILLCISRPESRIKVLSTHLTPYLSGSPATTPCGNYRALPLEKLYLRNETPMTVLKLSRTLGNFSLPKLTLLSAIGVSNLPCVMEMLEQGAQTLTHLILDLRSFPRGFELEFPSIPNLTHLQLKIQNNDQLGFKILQRIVQSQAKVQHVHITDESWTNVDSHLVQFAKNMPSLKLITVSRDRTGSTMGLTNSQILEKLSGTAAFGILRFSPAPEW
ncbi:hypothetical protein K435DRAFT_869649 [Dendrothele bispora CBS 962.96]|uniref:F-box domain-containing protein n=1 Tax=Dendrothele bispora (strain CBS 962.96) TaxID=1314807 RepID=A0A4S8L9C5_DENBC|nr:hypothetical protein K435DRAFT_869649 [Dendrothele bispora CBS 962.96]